MTANARATDGSIGDLRRVARLPVVLGIPALELREQEGHRVLARAHVPDRAGLLAVARQACGGERIERHALGAAGEQRLADAHAPVDALEGPDVEVLARVGAGQDRDLRLAEVERLDPAGLDERQHPERLDRRAQRDDSVGIAEDADEIARRRRPRRCRRDGRSPRCRCAAGARGSASQARGAAAGRGAVRRVRWAAGAVTGERISDGDGRALEQRGYRGERSGASVR